MSSIKNLQDRIEKLEQSMEDKIVVLRVVYEVSETPEEDNEGVGNVKKQETFTPEEVAVLEKYEEEMVAAAKPGKRPVVIYWTKDKAQELLAQAEKSDAQVATAAV